MAYKDLYAGYSARKNWVNLFAPSDVECALLDREFKRLSLEGRDLLDFGFGAGFLLAWASGKGARVAGIEIQPELVEAAKVSGVPVYGNLTEVPAASFDIVTAFDVLEHIPYTQLPDVMQQIFRCLRPGGIVMVRFPNCQSPAGLVNQFGDHTHVTMLAGPVVEALMVDAGFRDVMCRNAKTPGHSGLLRRFVKGVTLPIRYLFELAYRLTWSIGNTPMAGNVIVAARKPDVTQNDR